jgi:DNA adenine methylase
VATRVIGPLPYVGGKRRIANAIVRLIPSHTTYVEPFAGGAQVFFHKPRSQVEILNDQDEEILNFLTVCQQHPAELARQLRWQPASRRLFERHLAQPPALLSDIARAARFLYLQKNCWGGVRAKPTFHFAVTKGSNYRPDTLSEKLKQVAKRLDRVQVEHGSYEAMFDRYDRPSTFFYCDPPYVGLSLYRHNFTEAQFAQLAIRLRQLKGRFLLSINDCPKAREWFGNFSCLPVRLTYTARRTPQKVQELLFANYPLPPQFPEITHVD